MAEDPLSPRTPPKTLAERLSQTGSKISDLSKQAVSATKNAVAKAADAGKEAVTKTNEAVSNAVDAKRERKEEKLTQKIEDTRAELKEDGFIELAPAMITLPEFEEQRMALMAEEHEILVDLVDHMHALSSRIDQLEQTYKALAIEEKMKVTASLGDEEPASQTLKTSQGMTSALSLLGASLVWVMILTGIDRYITTNEWMLFETYPAEIPIWGLGAGTWVMFVLRTIGSSAPFLRVSTPMLVQTGLAVGITTMMALLLTNDTISTMSSVWTWGTAIAVAVLVSSSLVASAWRNTRSMLTPTEEVEIID
jgi:F0F1-type ATP synthase assembly protein I